MYCAPPRRGRACACRSPRAAPAVWGGRCAASRTPDVAGGVMPRNFLCAGRTCQTMGGTAATAACLAAVAAAIAAIAPAAAADYVMPTPLKQAEAGVEAGDILCNAGRILLVSPGGDPACVFAGSLGALADRGWLETPAESGGQGSGARPDAPSAAPSIPSAQEPREAGQDRTADSVARPVTHHNTLTVSKYPVVGEVAEITFTVTAIRDPVEFGIHPTYAKLVVGTIPSQSHRVFDVISNIGTGDPGVFRPYDYNNVTTMAQPGETYTVKAKFEILEEGVMGVGARGLHGDVIAIYIAASKNKSMPLDEYDATGQTYIDHTRVTGQEDSLHVEHDMGLSVPDYTLSRATLLGERYPMYSSFAEGYVELNYTEDQIVDELFYWGYLRSDIREFFVHIMNYTEEQADAVRMGDDLLAAAYRLGHGDTDEIVDDMLTRRNYTVAEVRDFFREHMYNTDDEAVAAILNAATTRTQAGAAE